MTKIARVYGGSLYDLAAEEKLDGQIMEQMIAVRQIFRENPGYLKLLGEPAIPEDERLKMIEEAFGGQAERYLVNFLKLLCERKILREFAGCCEEFIRRYNSAHGIAEAVVTSAVKLSDTQMEALKAKLEKLSGKKVYLVQKTDASVLGGLRVELEGVQLDGTVQSQLICDWRYHHLCAEIIVVRYFIGFLTLRLQIIHRLYQRQSRSACTTVPVSYTHLTLPTILRV